ncbi:MAG TPA: FHA domain-containing protein [Kofleriaceae bacterium]|nr:FHA domain-containing protein [Kofleriaceae bacterium]
MIMGGSTKTDVAASEWTIDDDVMRLRQWGTDVIQLLPPPPTNEWTIGAARTCAVQIDDPAGRVSRLHARLVRAQDGWLMHDLGSKNGVRIDGARRREIVLAPGVEIGIGGVTLIAESSRSVALRGFLARMLGWRSDRTEVVDRALRSIRLAATRRTALVLSGDGDLVPVARSIHRHVIGPDRPFVVCDPRRREVKATVRSAENYESGRDALAAATGGSLCIRLERRPRDFEAVITSLRSPGARVQLIVCTRNSAGCEPYLAPAIWIPPLNTRSDEIDRIIIEYAEDALDELGAARTSFLPGDRAWVRRYSAANLPEIEKGTLRLVALREARNLGEAAARLRMAPISLSRWIGRRELPMHVKL